MTARRGTAFRTEKLMTSKTLAAGLITSWLFILLSGASQIGARPVGADSIDETNLEFRLYV